MRNTKLLIFLFFLQLLLITVVLTYSKNIQCSFTHELKSDNAKIVADYKFFQKIKIVEKVFFAECITYNIYAQKFIHRKNVLKIYPGIIFFLKELCYLIYTDT